MDDKELHLLISSDTTEHKLELVKLLIERRHKARGCVFSRAGWQGGFLADFERNGKSHQRNILVLWNAESFEKDIRKAVNESANKITMNRAYSTLDCYVFGYLGNADELVDYAEYDQGMTLNIHDITEIAEDAKKTDYVANLSKVAKTTEQLPHVLDRNKKVLYDLFTTGATVAGIKNSFVASYIQLALYDNDSLHVSDLKDIVGKSLKNMSDTFFQSSLELELKSGHVEYDDGNCFLKEDFRKSLDLLMDSTSATERQLYEKFEECLGKYEIEDLAAKVLEKIIYIYQSHYRAEKEPFNSHDANDKRDRQLYNALVQIILNKGIDLVESRKITNELLTVVGESEYLNKTSLTGMFTNMFNSGQLEEYMSKQQRVVMLDTQILLNLLCLFYQDVDYRDILYDSTVMLWKQLIESKDYVDLYTTNGYVEEVANHLCEAHSLSRFLSLPYIRDMGASKNVFFNFYLYLSEKEHIEYDSFEDYLLDLLGYEEPIPRNHNEKKDLFYGIVADIFETALIGIKTLDTPEDLTPYQEEYKLVMTKCNMWYKSPGSKNRDILCSYYLSSENTFINQETKMPETPFLITLDRTMFPYMESLAKKFRRKRYYVYPPVKFANRLSVMNLKIDASKVNYNIICLTEKNYNSNTDAMSMMDVMSQIMNATSLEEKHTLQKLAALKRSQQDDINLKDFVTKNNDSLPIDVVLTDIFRHYRQINNAKLRQLGNLFENNNKTDLLVAILSKYCKQYLNTKLLKKDKMFEELDSLMA